MVKALVGKISKNRSIQLVQMLPMSVLPSLLQFETIISSTASVSLGMATSSLLSACTSEHEKPESTYNSNKSMFSKIRNLPPRASSIIYMAAAMSLHYGGYEFLRNSCLALFTSSEVGFSNAAAFPLANALISPFSLVVIWIYGRLLDYGGPRYALRNTTLMSIVFVLLASTILQCNTPHIVQQAVIGLSFLFQNSYSYMLSSQQWSFTDSVMTPNEGAFSRYSLMVEIRRLTKMNELGATYFSAITGFGSIVCVICGSLVPLLLPYTGLVGLFALTSVTLTASMLLADRAYFLAEKHGFDPSQQEVQSKVKNKNEKRNRFKETASLFRRVPTLGALLTEGLSFQSLNTVVNVALVRALKLELPDDLERTAFTGKFYAAVAGASAAMQFVLMPIFMKRLEPKMIWRVMPLVPFLVCLIQALALGSVPLVLICGAQFFTKTMDYSVRSTVYNLAYQPLDYESRFVGKEVISVLGSRFGKSGVSLVLSALTSAGLLSSLRDLSYLSLTASAGWIFS
jgi:ATP/ADP translocase